MVTVNVREKEGDTGIYQGEGLSRTVSTKSSETGLGPEHGGSSRRTLRCACWDNSSLRPEAARTVRTAGRLRGGEEVAGQAARHWCPESGLESVGFLKERHHGVALVTQGLPVDAASAAVAAQAADRLGGR